MPAARKNTLRLSQGEQVQDLQAALAKAVKEANYLKAHWTLAAGLLCADFVEDSFEVHWSISLRYANVSNLILILLEPSNCKRLRGQHGRALRRGNPCVFFMLWVPFKVLTTRTFWMSVAVLCCFVCLHCMLIWETQRMRETDGIIIHFAAKHPWFFIFYIHSSIPTMSKPWIGRYSMVRVLYITPKLRQRRGIQQELQQTVGEDTQMPAVNDDEFLATCPSIKYKHA